MDSREAFEAWAVKNNKFHVSGYNPNSDLFEAWQHQQARIDALEKEREALKLEISLLRSLGW